jgi:hypothetical protein
VTTTLPSEITAPPSSISDIPTGLLIDTRPSPEPTEHSSAASIGTAEVGLSVVSSDGGVSPTLAPQSGGDASDGRRCRGGPGWMIMAAVAALVGFVAV